MTMFYYEQRNPMGQWLPRLSHDGAPSSKGTETKRKIRNVREVPPEMRTFCLDSLKEIFNPQEVV